MNAVRLLPYAEADGPHNMAADETMLEAAERGAASLRFYGWSRPTLSLGYFQPHAVRESDPLLAALPWARRPTGGETLVHHHELTYALALPDGPPWQARGQSWLPLMHGIVAEALEGLGAAPESVGPEMRIGQVLCFLHHTGGDLQIGSAKVVGSAQRRRRGALLQHGAVLLAASPHTPRLLGVAELTGRRLAPAQVADSVRKSFVRGAEWRLEPADWTEYERGRIVALAAEKYTNPAWNAKR